MIIQRSSIYNMEKPNYYEDREWYEKRNQDLFKDKMAGLSNTELIIKYNISPARIVYLVKNERKKHE